MASWVARSAVPAEASRAAGVSFTIVASEDFPDGSTIDLPGARRPPGWLSSAVTDDAGGRVHAVHVALPDVPRLWYVELAEPDAVPAATTLIAYSDRRFAGGSVLTSTEAVAAGVTGARQVAAIRWLTDSGLVHQIYVQPAARRRGIAGKLATAGYTVQRVRGLPAVHGDGRRTTVGEAWLQSLPPALAARFAPLTEVMPDMTPALV